MKKILLFTSQYPSKTGDGNFIKNEIQVLSQSFDKVYIAKLNSKEGVDTYNIPENVEVVFEGFKGRIDIIKKGLLNTRSVWVVWKLFFNDILKIKKIAHLKWFFIAILIGRGVYANKKIREILQKNKENDLTLYFFWGTGMAYVIPWLKKLNHQICIRLHRGDLYEYRRGYIPLREEVLSRANNLITISNDGKLYLKEQLEAMKIASNKVSLIKLGTIDRKNKSDYKKKYEEKVIVSCSGISPVKRVPLIYQVLLEVSKEVKIRWVHFGDGVGMEQLKEQIKSVDTGNLITELKGYTLNEDIVEFYSTNQIDLFINLSSSEGIPVSIMEAISFNIPVVATNAGGTGEIVGEELDTGVLVPIDVDVDKVAQIVIEALKDNHKFNPRKYWETSFDSDKNNEKLIEVLKSNE